MRACLVKIVKPPMKSRRRLCKGRKYRWIRRRKGLALWMKLLSDCNRAISNFLCSGVIRYVASLESRDRTPISSIFVLHDFLFDTFFYFLFFWPKTWILKNSITGLLLCMHFLIGSRVIELREILEFSFSD